MGRPRCTWGLRLTVAVWMHLYWRPRQSLRQSVSLSSSKKFWHNLARPLQKHDPAEPNCSATLYTAPDGDTACCLTANDFSSGLNPVPTLRCPEGSCISSVVGTPDTYSGEPVFSQLVFTCIDPISEETTGQLPVTGGFYSAGVTDNLTSVTGVCLQGMQSTLSCTTKVDTGCDCR